MTMPQVQRDAMENAASQSPRLLLPLVLMTGLIVTSVLYFIAMPPDRWQYYLWTVRAWERLIGLR